MKTLITYFSHKGENYFGGRIVYINKGNTARVAEKLAAQTGGDLYEIRSASPYPETYGGDRRRGDSRTFRGYSPRARAENAGYRAVRHHISRVPQLVRHDAHGGQELSRKRGLFGQAHFSRMHARG